MTARLLQFRPDFLARLLIPPTCLGCGVLVDKSQALCPVCWRGLTFIERPFCEKYATPFALDAAPGMLSPQAHLHPPPWSRGRAAVLYGDVAARFVRGLKYSDRYDFAPFMARLMMRAGADVLVGADMICCVPLHWRRLMMRRYNQASLLARALARLGRKPYRGRILRRRRSTRSQVGLPREARERNLKGAFAVRRAQRKSVKGRSVLLVDDVMTSGATLRAASRALLRAGAREVNVLVFARVAEVLE